MYVYPQVTKHLMAGRLNFASGQITARPAQDGVVPSPYLDYLNDYGSWLWLTNLAAVAVTPTIDETGLVSGGGYLEINIPDITFTHAGALGSGSDVVDSILFYKDTGDPATSPLIGHDEIGPITVEAGLTFKYKQPDDGLLRLRIA
jgi:hypothetical protein